MKALSELRALMEVLLDRMSRLPPSPPHDSWHKPSEDGSAHACSASTAIADATDHSSSEREAEQLALKIGHLAALTFKDRAISASDLKGWLVDESYARVMRLSDDTKCKVPVGEPGARVATNVRPSGPAPAHLSVVLAALDHGWHRASITPSVTLRSTMPDMSDTNQCGAVGRSPFGFTTRRSRGRAPFATLQRCATPSVAPAALEVVAGQLQSGGRDRLQSSSAPTVGPSRI
jgi:hypothetical protein